MSGNIHISYHDNMHPQTITVECVTEGQSAANGPYYRLKFGDDMTIFMDPKRLWDLGLAISKAPLPEQAAIANALSAKATAEAA